MRRGFVTVVVLALVGSAAPLARATTLTVTTTADEVSGTDGTCSLREAIAVAASHMPSGATLGECPAGEAAANTIVLGADSYKLTRQGAGDQNGDLDLGAAITGLTITGAGPSATTIDASGAANRALEIAQGASATIQHLTISGARAPVGAAGQMNGQAGGPGDDGGAISNDGMLVLSDLVLSDNRAGSGGGAQQGDGGAGGRGGAIYNAGTLNIDHTLITGSIGGAAAGGSVGPGPPVGGNGGDGGGIYNDGGGTLTLTDSTLESNAAGRGGGGGNDVDHGTGGAAGGDGGGLFNATNGVLTLLRATVSGNHAGLGGNGGSGGLTAGSGGPGGRGGGVSGEASWSATNVTITANFAGNGGNGGSAVTPGNGGAGGFGGGIAQPTTGTLALSHTTVTQNGVGNGGNPGTGQNSGSAGAAGSGGGIRQASNATVNLKNSIVALNGAANCSGAIVNQAHNISFPDTTCPGTNVDPLLGAFQDNGGPTKTIALGSGSPAIDAVPASGAGCATLDQRGIERPVGPACDIGAVEVAGPAATTGAGTGVTDSAATLSGSVTPNAGDATVYFDYGPTTAYGSQSAVQHVAGLAALPVSLPVAGLSPMTTYHFRIVITAPAGTATGADATFTTLSAPPTPTPTPTPGTGGGDSPAIAVLKIGPTAFVAAASGPSIAPGGPGATVSYSAAIAGVTTFTVSRATAGERSGKRCVKPKPRKRGRATRPRRCTRYVRVGSFKHNDVAGANTFHFTGRVGGHRLAPGSYRLDATPRASGKTGKTISVKFRIVR